MPNLDKATSTGAALIIGGTGAIGSALARQCLESGRYARVVTTSRRDTGDAIPLDLADEPSIELASQEVATLLDGMPLTRIAICTGVLHADGVQPERRIASLEPDPFLELMRINALGPLLVARHFAALLPRSEPSQLAAISARVGSISDNRLGGWYSYRCSKAALNQGFQTLSVEFKRTHPQCVLTLFHPGTVDTRLSRPFHQGVAPDKLFTPECAARQFDEVLEARTQPGGPLFVDWQNQPVEF